MPAESGLAVAVTMAAALGQGSVSVAFPASFLPQFVSVVLDVGLLFQTPVICLSRFHPHDHNIPDRSDKVGVISSLVGSSLNTRSSTLLLTYISVDDYGVLAV